MTPPDYEYLRKLLKDQSGLDLSADKQYLIESRLVPLSRKAGLAGIPELVQNDVCGWLVPAGSVDDVAVAMRSALDTPAARLTQLGEAGRERVKAMHDANKNAEALLRLFEQYA